MTVCMCVCIRENISYPQPSLDSCAHSWGCEPNGTDQPRPGEVMCPHLKRFKALGCAQPSG